MPYNLHVNGLARPSSSGPHPTQTLSSRPEARICVAAEIGACRGGTVMEWLILRSGRLGRFGLGLRVRASICRTFSLRRFRWDRPQGFALGWYIVGPLALKQQQQQRQRQQQRQKQRQPQRQRQPQEQIQGPLHPTGQEPPAGDPDLRFAPVEKAESGWGSVEMPLSGGPRQAPWAGDERHSSCSAPKRRS